MLSKYGMLNIHNTKKVIKIEINFHFSFSRTKLKQINKSFKKTKANCQSKFPVGSQSCRTCVEPEVHKLI